MTNGVRQRSRRSLAPSSPLFLALLLLAGCASSGGFFQSPFVAASEPWELPPGSYPTQRLYRVKYRGPEGDLGFKLALYLEGEARYRMLASDLGRKLWSLAVDGRDAVWLDYKRKEYCRSTAAAELRFVPLAELPLVALPNLLLGRLPAAPSASLERSEDRISFLDVRGQQWSGSLNGDQLVWWSLVEAGEAVVWWRREERGGLFTDREGEQEVRWEEIVREPLEGPLEGLDVPGRYSKAECGAAAD